MRQDCSAADRNAVVFASGTEEVMQIQPYLFFEGRCDEAIEFYRSAVGAEVSMLMRFKEAPPSDQSMMAPGTADKVMHAAVKIGDSTVLMSDGRCGGSAAFAGFSLSLSVESEAEAAKAFDALAEGGNIGMPLGKTFFASQFGMLTDRFGVMWMVMSEH
jgi:PhnB protein